MPDMPQSILSTLLMVVGPIILLAAIAYGTFQSSRRRMAATDKTRERATRQIYERGAQEEARASAAPVPALAASLASRISGTGWIAIFVLGVVLFGGLAWWTSGDRTSPGVVPDATTGQGAPTPSPPATNR